MNLSVNSLELFSFAYSCPIGNKSRFVNLPFFAHNQLKNIFLLILISSFLPEAKYIEQLGNILMIKMSLTEFHKISISQYIPEIAILFMSFFRIDSSNF